MQTGESTNYMKEHAGLGHGVGLAKGTVAEGWIEDAVAFWEKHM